MRLINVVLGFGIVLGIQIPIGPYCRAHGALLTESVAGVLDHLHNLVMRSDE